MIYFESSILPSRYFISKSKFKEKLFRNRVNKSTYSSLTSMKKGEFVTLKIHLFIHSPKLNLCYWEKISRHLN